MKIRCFKCKGKGRVKDDKLAGARVLLGILSFGIGFIVSDKIKCSACNGSGYLENN